MSLGRRFLVVDDEPRIRLQEFHHSGEHAEHLDRVQPAAHQQQDGWHQDHQADSDGFRLADVGGELRQRGQRPAAVMRGEQRMNEV